jgi:hypothetical protein
LFNYRPTLITQDCSLAEIKKSKNLFCSQSCAASWNNRQKRKSKRSKCETLLYSLLVNEFSDLIILPNDKTMLNGLEADIAIPELKLAIEWNGIVHYKPIFGETKYQKILTNDEQKKNIALQNDINLIVIPDLVSKASYVQEVFFNIKKIILSLRDSGQNRTD